MSDNLIEFNNISKFFGSVIALKDVTMHIKRGQIMCLLGDNGAGKSTLIKTLSGVHKPDEGEINYPYLFKTVDASGYDGWIGCEYVPRADTRSGLGWGSVYGLKTK